MRRLGAVLLAITWLARGQDDWTHTVRIAGHGPAPDRLEAIVHSAAETNVFGIEVDNDIPGRYESFLHPEQKLKDIRAMAEKAHAAGNRAFLYVAARVHHGGRGGTTPLVLQGPSRLGAAQPQRRAGDVRRRRKFAGEKRSPRAHHHTSRTADYQPGETAMLRTVSLKKAAFIR